MEKYKIDPGHQPDHRIPRFQVQFVIRPQTEEPTITAAMPAKVISGVYKKATGSGSSRGLETTLTQLETAGQPVTKSSHPNQW